MARRRKRKPVPEAPIEVTIDKLSHEGRGIAQVDGKVVFVDGALPGEQVLMKYAMVHSKFDEGYVEQVLQASETRVEAPCAHFSGCGGCSLQHMASEAQIEFKQSILAEQLDHFGATQPLTWLEPMQLDTLGYRKKARLGVKFVVKKDACLVGFREKRSSFLAQIDSCEVLLPKVGQLITPLREMIATMDAKQSTPQIELAAGDQQVAFIIRHMEPMTEADQAKWIEFAQQNNIELYFQPKGPATVHKVWPENTESRLSYELPEFGIKLKFHPTDFTQVNTSINRSMVKLAIDLLDPREDDRILDLFCGLGNFTIPLATRAGHVVGVEGVDEMVKRGYENAALNQISNVEFHQADLQTDFSSQPWAKDGFNKILIDPPRSGALDVVNYLPKFGATRVVYVSCNPATLARDAGALKEAGYEMIQAGVMDMFPHTAHVESIALFEKKS